MSRRYLPLSLALLLPVSCAWNRPGIDPRKMLQPQSGHASPTAAPTPGDVTPATRLIDRIQERGIEAQAIDASHTDADPSLESPKVGYQAGRATLYLFAYPDGFDAEAAGLQSGNVIPQMREGNVLR